MKTSVRSVDISWIYYGHLHQFVPLNKVHMPQQKALLGIFFNQMGRFCDLQWLNSTTFLSPFMQSSHGKPPGQGRRKKWHCGARGEEISTTRMSLTLVPGSCNGGWRIQYRRLAGLNIFVGPAASLWKEVHNRFIWFRIWTGGHAGTQDEIGFYFFSVAVAVVVVF